MNPVPLLQPDWAEDFSEQMETVLHEADMYHLAYNHSDIKAIERILTVWIGNECPLFEALIYMKEVKSIKEWITHYNACIALKFVYFWVEKVGNIPQHTAHKIYDLANFAVKECGYVLGYDDAHALVETFVLKIDTDEKLEDAKRKMKSGSFREWYMSYSDEYQIYYLRKILLNRFDNCQPLMAYNLIRNAINAGYSFEWLKTVCTSCESWHDFKKNLGV